LDFPIPEVSENEEKDKSSIITAEEKKEPNLTDLY
jgi:hypothetical protein